MSTADAEKLDQSFTSNSLGKNDSLRPDNGDHETVPPLLVSGSSDHKDESAPEALPIGSEPLQRLSTPRLAFLTLGLLLTNFLGGCSTGAVAILIPSMARTLRVSELQAQWIASAYTLSFACGLLFSGRMGDIYGRKRLYVLGMAIYVASSIITGIVKNRAVLCFTRAISGLGMSIASPAGFGIIGVSVRHEPARTIVFAASGLGNPLGAVFGNLIGGEYRDGWAYLFFLLGGLAALLLAGAVLVVPPDPRDQSSDHDRRIDWVGGLLITSGICLFMLSLTESGVSPRGWRSPYVPALLATSLVLLVLAVTWSLWLELRTSYPPIIKMTLFTRRHGLIGSICACCLLMTACIFAWIYTTTIFYQNYKGQTALGNSISTLPAPIAGTIAAGALMYLAPRVRAPWLLGVGSAMTASASLMYGLWPNGTIFWALEFPAQIIHPWGIDFVFGLGTILMSNLVEPKEQSVGGAIFQTSGQLGSALGISLSSLISTEIGDQEDVLSGLRAAFYFSAALGYMVTLVVIVGMRRVRLAKDVGEIE